jgi:hypothetical protein
VICALAALCTAFAVGTAVAVEEPPHAAAHPPARSGEAPARATESPRGTAAPRAIESPPAFVPRAAPSRAVSPAPAMRPSINGLALDARHNHGRYYAPVGAVTRVLPPDHRPYYLHGQRYFFSNGAWYAARGSAFVVVAAPVGIVVSGLPPYCTPVWYGGVPYYYADNAYYAWQPDQNGYAVVDPPDGSVPPQDAGSAADPAGSPYPGAAAAPAASTPDFVIYPKNGQSKDQQAADQYDCGNWAKAQTGFDPALPGGGVTPDDADRTHGNFDRAYAACLQGRGYQLN